MHSITFTVIKIAIEVFFANTNATMEQRENYFALKTAYSLKSQTLNWS